MKSTNTLPYGRLIKQLKEAREALGLTQARLGELTGMTQSAVSKVESKERNLGLVEFIRWTDTLGLDGPELIAELRQAMTAPRHHRLLPRRETTSR